MNDLNLTENAKSRLRFLREQNPEQKKYFLRLTVDAGGCSGFQYVFKFDDNKQQDDISFHDGEFEIVTDATSLDLIKGSQIDYLEDLIGAAFIVKNPNSSSNCGCGNSFMI